MKTLLKLLTNNLSYKVLAVVLAFLIWFYIVSQGLKEIEVSLPITVTAPEGWVVLSIQPSTVTLRLTGPHLAVDLLRRQKVMVRINVRERKLEGRSPPVTLRPGIGEGDLVLPQEVDPREIRLLWTSPEHADLVLDKLIEKELGIEIELKGRVREGLRVNARPTVKTCLVRGPQSVLEGENIATIKTEPILITGLEPGIYLREIELLREVNSGRYGRVEVFPRGRAEVLIYVELEIVSKEFSDVKISVLNRPGAPLGVRLEKDSVDLVVEGQKQVVEKLKPEDIRVFVDLRNTRKDELPAMLPLKVDFPYDGLKLKREPAQIRVDPVGG